MGVLSISFPFEFLGPVPRKFMVGAVGHFTLQLMARTNHKFPRYGARRSKGSEIDSTYKHAPVLINHDVNNIDLHNLFACTCST